MRNFYFVLVGFVIFLISCNKQKDISVDKVAIYTPMSIGNYWVYDVSLIDTLGNATFVNYDSTYVESDTVINGKLFFVFKSSSSLSYQQFLRDSANYLVDESGERFFHPNNFNDTLYSNVITNSNNDTINYTYRIMRKPSEHINTMSGMYDVLDAQTIRSLPFLNLKTKSHYFYAQGIGLVMRQDFPIFNKVRTYNLIRYYIDK